MLICHRRGLKFISAVAVILKESSVHALHQVKELR